MNKRKALRVDITNMCNLNCEYCYVKKDSPKFLNYNLINGMMQYMRENRDHFTNFVSFFGGEPSLCHNIISKIISDNPDFDFGIISNGYRLWEYNDVDFYKRFKKLTFTLAGTEKSYNKLRGEHGLRDRIERLVQLSKDEFKNSGISINIDITGYLLDDIDEFISNVEYIVNNKITCHLYSIRGENHFDDVNDMLRFLDLLTDDIRDHLIRLDDYEISNTPFLCGFSDMITINCEGKLSACGLYDVYGDATDFSLSNNITNSILKNHKSLWVGCSNCVVPVGLCQVSCPSWIRECVENGNIEVLEKCCDFERVKEYKRREIINNRKKVK